MVHKPKHNAQFKTNADGFSTFILFDGKQVTLRDRTLTDLERLESWTAIAPISYVIKAVVLLCVKWGEDPGVTEDELRGYLETRIRDAQLLDKALAEHCKSEEFEL